MAQPIIRGVQAVGAVSIYYAYNGNSGTLSLPNNLIKNGSIASISTGSGGVPVVGFRLDGEFLRATQQIASSVMIPILGGGAIALTNNNRSGTLSINCVKSTTPDTSSFAAYTKDGIGIFASDTTDSSTSYYDLITLAQAQQAQYGGDDAGSTITVEFKFNTMTTKIEFQGCTIANIDPLGLSGNDAVNYNVQINYLNWVISYNAS